MDIQVNKRYKLIQIVPRMSPKRCGISDHALLLAEALKDKYDIDTVFITSIMYTGEHIGFPVVCCSMDKMTNVFEKNDTKILVHLSGYGYDANGVPDGLYRVMRQIFQKYRVEFAVYYHELFYRDWTPWRKSYWMSFRQRLAVNKIGAICKLKITSTNLYAEYIRRHSSSSDHVYVLPVFSTIGNTGDSIQNNQRENSLVIFGLEPSRRRAYRMLNKNEDTIERLRIKYIYDIGCGDVSSEWKGKYAKKIIRMGVLEKNDISKILQRVWFGYVPCDPVCAAKSSVMAAYCSNGVIPIFARPYKGIIDGLLSNAHTVSLSDNCIIDIEKLEAMSKSVKRWYDEHSIGKHACLYNRWIRE